MGRSFTDPERLPSTDTLLGPAPISQLCRCDSDYDVFSPATGVPQRARSPATQPTRIDHASLDLTPSVEICNTNTTCEHICEPRIPAGDRADCPTCHAAAMTSLRRRLRRGPHDPLFTFSVARSCERPACAGEGPHGPKEPESRGRTKRRFPARSCFRACPRRPSAPHRIGISPAWTADRPRPPLHHVPATGRDFAKTGQLSTCRDSRVTRRIAPGVRGNRSPPPPPFTSYERGEPAPLEPA